MMILHILQMNVRKLTLLKKVQRLCRGKRSADPEFSCKRRRKRRSVHFEFKFIYIYFPPKHVHILKWNSWTTIQLHRANQNIFTDFTTWPLASFYDQFILISSRFFFCCVFWSSPCDLSVWVKSGNVIIHQIVNIWVFAYWLHFSFIHQFSSSMCTVEKAIVIKTHQ